jgi:hypothetical protein
VQQFKNLGLPTNSTCRIVRTLYRKYYCTRIFVIQYVSIVTPCLMLWCLPGPIRGLNEPSKDWLCSSKDWLCSSKAWLSPSGACCAHSRPWPRPSLAGPIPSEDHYRAYQSTDWALWRPNGTNSGPDWGCLRPGRAHRRPCWAKPRPDWAHPRPSWAPKSPGWADWDHPSPGWADPRPDLGYLRPG